MTPGTRPRRARPTPARGGVGLARALLDDAIGHDGAGRLSEAVACYTRAIAAADAAGERALLAEALRRMADVHRRRSEVDAAVELCGRSRAVAESIGDAVLAAEAVNALAVVHVEVGALDVARTAFAEALRMGGARSPLLRGGIEQNLGVLANIHGDWEAALAHYERSLEAFRAAGDERRCAMAYNNLGLLSADRARWADADAYYERAITAADAAGNVYLRGLALMNRSEVLLAQARYADAMRGAEEARATFEQLGAPRHVSETHRLTGVVLRETGEPRLAEERLRTAVDLAVAAGAPLEEAEASRELAILCQRAGRNQDALRLLNASHRLFQRLDARRDLVDVGAKVTDLEGTYMAVVRDWGQSIESADSYTHGHCERVATYAVAVARALGLADEDVTTVRLGAYLHDLGKVKTPHGVLNKRGRLTPEELAIMQRHPVDGVEMLDGIEFPWDLKPMIRWHHERHDGTGYPDGLAGDAIPLHAQIICVADVWDALTTTRSYRPALPRAQALAIMSESRHHWRRDVFEAFMALPAEATTPA